MAELRMVIVEWNDAQDHADKWVDEEDARKFGEADCKVTSVGFLVSQTSKYVTLAGDWDASDRDLGRVTKVPIGMILSMKDLSEG